MDDLWGDDELDADVVEECVLLATQASLCSSPKAQQRQYQNFSECKQNYSFEFKQPSNVKKFTSTQKNATLPSTSSSESKALDSTLELEHLRDENHKLFETNLQKEGETSILRAEVMSLRTQREKIETETSQELAALKKQLTEKTLQHTKELEASKTEMKFKELELEELRSKCRRIEQNVKDQQRICKTIPVTDAMEHNIGKKFLSRNTFDTGKDFDKKTVMVDSAVQTDTSREPRFDSFHVQRLDHPTDTTILVETLKFSLLSTPHDLGSYTFELDQLKMRMVKETNPKHLFPIFHSSEPSLIEIICNNIERLNNSHDMKLHIELLTCWITHVLPFVEKSIQDRLIQTVLCGIKRASVLDIMTILSAIVARFGLSPICSKHTGCMLEKVAFSLKDSYMSFAPEKQCESAHHLVLTLSAMLASPTDGNSLLKKCPCIPHLLKALVFIVQHQIELDSLTTHAVYRRLGLFKEAFRLSLGILNSRREPWLTFKQSPAELNRLYTVLTAISVEFPVPDDMNNELNVMAFTVPGFGL